MEVAFKYQKEKIKIIKIQHRHTVMKSISHVILGRLLTNFFFTPKFFSFQVPILERFDFRYFYLDLKSSKKPC